MLGNVNAPFCPLPLNKGGEEPQLLPSGSKLQNNEKKCTICGKPIKLAAIKCKHCGSMLQRLNKHPPDSRSPLSENDKLLGKKDAIKPFENGGAIKTLVNLIEKIIDVDKLKNQIELLRNENGWSDSAISEYFIECLVPNKKKASQKAVLLKYIPVVGKATHSACTIYTEVKDRSFKIKNYLTCIAGISLIFDNTISTPGDLCIPVAKTFSYSVAPAIAENLPLKVQPNTSIATYYKEVVTKVTQKLLMEFGIKVAGNILGSVPLAGALIKRGFDNQVGDKTQLFSRRNLYNLRETYEKKYSTNSESPNGIQKTIVIQAVRNEANIDSIIQLLNRLEKKERFYLKGKYKPETEKKVRSVYCISNNDEILCIFDNSAFGSCKQGVAFTQRGIYIKKVLESTTFLSYNELSFSQMRFEPGFMTNKIYFDVEGVEYKIEATDKNPAKLLYNTLCRITGQSLNFNGPPPLS